jgi:uncharacterized Zn finger protein
MCNIEFEMPTPCKKCGEIFELLEGLTSERWFPNTIICAECWHQEEEEIIRLNEIEDLKISISDAEITIKDAEKQLLEYGAQLPHLIADNEEKAFSIGEQYTGKPHGWIQWKGTNVCMDFHCKCGHHGHIDADFAYNVKCGKCGTVYAMNGHIQLIELKVVDHDELIVLAK